MVGMPQLAGVIDSRCPELPLVEKRISDVLRAQGAFADEITRYLAKSGGKRVRPTLVLLFAGMGQKNRPHKTDDIIDVAAAVEIVHMASLVHDDVIDESELRRGDATVNAQWGNRLAVLSGDFLFASAFCLLSRRGLCRELKVVSEAVRDMCEGEMEQASARFDPDLPEEIYMEHIKKKTASLMGAACEVGAILAGFSMSHVRAAGDFGIKLGCAFQIVDDLLDISANAETLGKPAGSDLNQGVFTLPLLQAIKTGCLDQEIRDQLKDKLDTSAEKHILDTIRMTDGVHYAYNKAISIISAAKERLALFPEINNRDILFRMADFVLERTY